ncbi:MAG: pitrilysin family protein [Synechocystis sp.]|nr:pitrilysin family protein [Synechocystis sp.]
MRIPSPLARLFPVSTRQQRWQRFWGLVCSSVIVVVGLFGAFTLPAATARPLTPAPTPKNYDQLTFPPLPELKIPAYDRYTLPNGLVVYLMEDRKLPLVSGTAILRAGERWEPADKVGLADLTGLTMRLGGTQQHPPSDLNQLLEQRAAAIETSINLSSGSASFSALSKDLETVFSLFAEVVQTPAFDPAQVDLAKNQLRGAIARRNDDPGDIASREFKKLLYGADSPYARTMEYETLAAIQRQDLIDFHQRYIRPEQMILGIVGDFDSETIKPLIAEQFGQWQGNGTAPSLKPPGAEQATKTGIFVADLPHLTQSNVLLGQLGGEVNDPDYPALSVMNGVLGGLSGRLFNNIRSKQGLAYSVSGRWQAAYDYPGYFIAGGPTRTETTVPFVQSLFAEFERLRQEPITPAELAYAKDSILNSFVFNFEQPGQTLSRLMTYEYYGYPADFIFTFQRQVVATTIEDVQRVAKTHLHPDRLFTVVVGHGDRLEAELSALNQPVETLDVTIPDP